MAKQNDKFEKVEIVVRPEDLHPYTRASDDASLVTCFMRDIGRTVSLYFNNEHKKAFEEGKEVHFFLKPTQKLFSVLDYDHREEKDKAEGRPVSCQYVAETFKNRYEQEDRLKVAAEAKENKQENPWSYIASFVNELYATNNQSSNSVNALAWEFVQELVPQAEALEFVDYLNNSFPDAAASISAKKQAEEKAETATAQPKVENPQEKPTKKAAEAQENTEQKTEPKVMPNTDKNAEQTTETKAEPKNEAETKAQPKRAKEIAYKFEKTFEVDEGTNEYVNHDTDYSLVYNEDTNKFTYLRYEDNVLKESEEISPEEAKTLCKDKEWSHSEDALKVINDATKKAQAPKEETTQSESASREQAPQTEPEPKAQETKTEPVPEQNNKSQTHEEKPNWNRSEGILNLKYFIEGNQADLFEVKVNCIPSNTSGNLYFFYDSYHNNKQVEHKEISAAEAQKMFNTNPANKMPNLNVCSEENFFVHTNNAEVLIKRGLEQETAQKAASHKTKLHM